MELISRNAALNGSVRIPASKSHTIRALLIATLADGESVLTDPLFSGDTESCLQACEQLGARVDASVYNAIRVKALLGQLSPDAQELAKAAAETGLNFTLDTLAQASHLARSDLDTALDELLKRHVVSERDEGTYGFAHAKLYEAVLGT